MTGMISWEKHRMRQLSLDSSRKIVKRNSVRRACNPPEI
jgi:hypothetical protein